MHDAVKYSSSDWRKCYRARETSDKKTTAWDEMSFGWPSDGDESRGFGMKNQIFLEKQKCLWEQCDIKKVLYEHL